MDISKYHETQINEFPELSFVKAIDGSGNPNELKKSAVKMPNTRYWEMQERGIGVLLLVSMFLLMAILINFSGVFPFVWDFFVVGALRLVGLA